MTRRQIARKLKILKNRAKYFMLAFGFAGLSSTAPMLSGCSDTKNKDKVETTHDLTGDKAVATISYRTDTLYHASTTFALYLNGKITRYYVENNNKYQLQLPLFVHEDWHRHNFNTGFRTKSKLSPFEYYKICLQDEMTANLAAILTARLEYLGAEDKDAVIKKYENGYMRFYFKAVKDGTIRPDAFVFSNEEKKFLANGVQKMWLRIYYKIYAPRILRMIPRYIERRGLVKENPLQYKKYVKQFWTIGGIDFSAYLDEDIGIDYDAKVNFAKASANMVSLKKDAPFLIENIASNLPYLREFSGKDQINAFLHIVIAAKLKSAVKECSAASLSDNKEAITQIYKKTVAELSYDAALEEFALSYGFLEKNAFNTCLKTDNYHDKISRLYTYKGVDLSALIDGFNADKTPFSKETFEPEKFKFYINDDAYFMPTPRIFSENADNTGTKNEKPALRQRISEPQYIDIPNFW